MQLPSLSGHPELVPALYVRLVDPVRGPVSADEERLEAEYGTMLLEADRARARLGEAASVLRSFGARAIAMKGAAHVLSLYTGALPRHLSDLDLVVHEQDLDRATNALRGLGYEPEPWNSPEDAFLQAQEGPGLRCLAQGRVALDLQTRLPGHPANSPALEEAWAAAHRELSESSDLSDESDLSDLSDPPDAGLLLLHPLHELLVAAAHFCVHLRPPLTQSPKWATDMLLMIHRNATGRHPRIGRPAKGATFEEKLASLQLRDLVWPFAEPVSGEQPPGWEPTWTWEQFWDTARRWDIVEQCQLVGATLNAYWDAGVPGIPAGCEAVALERLFENHPEHGLHSAASVPAAYMERIARFRALPNHGARLRYLLSLAFPSDASLRHRYGLAPDAPILPYRLLHPMRTGWKLARGMGAWAALRLRGR